MGRPAAVASRAVSDPQIERTFWNRWNAEARERIQGDVSLDQARVVTGWLEGERGLRILDAGCGTGWMSERLVPFGTVVGTDLADEVVDRAAARVPDVTFVAGDVMTVDVGSEFDVIVSLEVLSHVPDQAGLLGRFHSLLRPGGRLLLATQNRPVLERLNRIPPPAPGQRRAWVDRDELRDLLRGAGFSIEEMRVITPTADHGPMRVVAKLGRVLHCSHLLERAGFGWTIVVRARRPG